MSLIKWDDSLSVNIAELDRQHQRLIGMINDLDEAMRQGKGNDALGKILNGLMAYAATHFRLEEKYFHQFGYPEAAGHMEEHAAFEKKVSELKDGFEKGELGSSITVMGFLCRWLENHIKGVDRKYGAFFNDKGLK